MHLPIELPKPGAHADCLFSDAFTKREAASEELYIRQEEKAKYVQLGTVDDTTRLHTIRTLAVRIQGIFLTADRLMAIKEKLRMQRQHMDDLDKHMLVIPIGVGYETRLTARQ